MVRVEAMPGDTSLVGRTATVSKQNSVFASAAFGTSRVGASPSGLSVSGGMRDDRTSAAGTPGAGVGLPSLSSGPIVTSGMLPQDLPTIKGGSHLDSTPSAMPSVIVPPRRSATLEYSVDDAENYVQEEEEEEETTTIGQSTAQQFQNSLAIVAPNFLARKTKESIPIVNEHSFQRLGEIGRYMRRSMAEVRLEGYSMTQLSPKSPFRARCALIVFNPAFELFVLVLVLMWCFAVAIKPVDGNMPGFDAINYLTAAVFTAEVILKIISLGFLMGRRAFLKTSSNVLDFVVITMIWLEILGSSWSVSVAPFRVFRVFLPIRFFKQFGAVRSIVGSVIAAVKPLLQVLLLLLLIFVVYAIWGIQVYGHSMRRRCFTDNTNTSLIPDRFCGFDDPDETDYMDPSNCPQDSHCVLTPYNPQYNLVGFDHLGVSLLSLWEIQSLDNWEQTFVVPLLQSEPKLRAITWMMMFSFLVMSSMVGVSLIIGVILDSFAVTREDEGHGIFSKDLGDNKDEQKHQRYLQERAEAHARALVLRSQTYQRSDDWWRKILESKKAEVFILTAIALNAVALCIEYENQPSTLTTILDAAEYVFIVIFTVELLLKLHAYGPRGFIDNPSNIFDALIVVLAIASLPLEFQYHGSRSITILRTFRVLRVTRLIMRIKPLFALLQGVLRSVNTVANMMFVMLFALFAMALMGKELFGGKITGIRSQFDTFPQCVLTLFQIATGDNWVATLTAAMNGPDRQDNSPLTGPQTVDAMVAALYFAAVFVWSRYIVTALLISALLENFEVVEPQSSAEKIQEAASRMRKALGRIDVQIAVETDKPEVGSRRWVETASGAPENHTGLGWIKNTRKSCRATVRSKSFRYALLSATILSSFSMCLGGPPGREDIVVPNIAIVVLDIIFAIVFIIECVIKVTADHKFYFANPWDRLDLFVLLVTLADLMAGGALAGGRVLRALRIVRTLKFVGRNQDMKNVVEAVLQSLGTLVNVAILFVVLLIVFGVFGRGIYGGLMFDCNDIQGVVYPMGNIECVGTFVHDQILLPRVWSNFPANFDNIIEGFIALYRCVSLQWVDLNFRAMDITDFDLQTKKDYNASSALYFITFVFISRYFVAALFVTVVIAYYHKVMMQSALSAQQRSFHRTVNVDVPTHYWRSRPPPKDSNRRAVFKSVRKKTMKKFSFILLCINSFLLLTISADMSSDWAGLLRAFDGIFVVIFFCESGAKLFGVGWKLFRTRNWFMFEGILAVGGLVMLPFDAAELTFGIYGARLVRSLRMLRLLNFSAPLKIVMKSLSHSALPLVNVAILTFIVNGIFAVVAISLFGNTRAGSTLSQDSFSDFLAAQGTLFSAIMMGKWDLMMEDAWVRTPHCTETRTVGGEEIIGDCGSILSAPFFISHQILTNLILLNIAAAVIVNHYGQVKRAMREKPTVSANDLDKFRTHFNKLSEDGKAIRVAFLGRLLSEAALPLHVQASSRSVFVKSTTGSAFFAKCVRAEVLRLLYKELEHDRRHRIRRYKKKLKMVRFYNKMIAKNDFLAKHALLPEPRPPADLHNPRDKDEHQAELDKLAKAVDDAGRDVALTAEERLKREMELAARIARVEDAPVEKVEFLEEEDAEYEESPEEKARREKLKQTHAAYRRGKYVRDMQHTEVEYMSGRLQNARVPYKMLLVTALKWTVDVSYLPREQQAKRADVVAAVKSHVGASSFIALLRGHAERRRKKYERRRKLKSVMRAVRMTERLKRIMEAARAERNKPPPDPDENAYTVVVRTGDSAEAESTSPAYVILRGSDGDSTRMRLEGDLPEGRRHWFERGSEDTFRVDAGKPLGLITSIVIGHDATGLGANWEIDWIKVTSRQCWEFEFKCGRWLRGNRKELDLVPTRTVDPSKSGHYGIQVVTGNDFGAGTDSDVAIKLVGSNGESDWISLEETVDKKIDKFEGGAVDEFHVDAGSDLGTLDAIHVATDASGVGAAWQLGHVIVSNNAGFEWMFVCNEWLDVTNPVVSLAVARKRDPYQKSAGVYRVTVKTGTSIGAGTDANIYIELWGAGGRTSGRQMLEEDEANSLNKFEAGSEDVFVFDIWEDLGDIDHIDIGHDATGIGADWQLDTVLVENSLGWVWMFDADMWLDGTKTHIQLRPTQLKDPRRDADGLYKVMVETGDEVGAGTDANIFISLKAQAGPGSGRLPLERGLERRLDMFERAQMDSFEIDAGRDLGLLESITLTVKSDALSFGDKWLVVRVVVSHASGWQWDFKCHEWLGSKRPSVTLDPTKVRPPPRPTEQLVPSKEIPLTAAEQILAETAANVTVGDANVTVGSPPPAAMPSFAGDSQQPSIFGRTLQRISEAIGKPLEAALGNHESWSLRREETADDTVITADIGPDSSVQPQPQLPLRQLPPPHRVDLGARRQRAAGVSATANNAHSEVSMSSEAMLDHGTRSVGQQHDKKQSSPNATTSEGVRAPTKTTVAMTEEEKLEAQALEHIQLLREKVAISQAHAKADAAALSKEAEDERIRIEAAQAAAANGVIGGTPETAAEVEAERRLLYMRAAIRGNLLAQERVTAISHAKGLGGQLPELMTKPPIVPHVAQQPPQQPRLHGLPSMLPHMDVSGVGVGVGDTTDLSLMSPLVGQVLNPSPLPGPHSFYGGDRVGQL